MHTYIPLKASSTVSGSDRSESDITNKLASLGAKICYGHNKELLEACIPLRDYSYFVSRIRFHQQTMDLKKAVDAALRELDDASIIKPFLTNDHQCIFRFLVPFIYKKRISIIIDNEHIIWCNIKSLFCISQTSFVAFKI